MYPSNAGVYDQFLLRRSQHGADRCHDDDDEEEDDDVDDLYLSNAGVDDQLLLRHSQHGADRCHNDDDDNDDDDDLTCRMPALTTSSSCVIPSTALTRATLSAISSLSWRHFLVSRRSFSCTRFSVLYSFSNSPRNLSRPSSPAISASVCTQQRAQIHIRFINRLDFGALTLLVGRREEHPGCKN